MVVHVMYTVTGPQWREEGCWLAGPPQVGQSLSKDFMRLSSGPCHCPSEKALHVRVLKMGQPDDSTSPTVSRRWLTRAGGP